MRKISLAVIFCLVISLFPVGHVIAINNPVISVDNVVVPSNQNTTDYIMIPIRTTGFIDNVIGGHIDISFDTSKLYYDYTSEYPQGNIYIYYDEFTPTWYDCSVGDPNDTGLFSIYYSFNEFSYNDSHVVPGVSDILTYVTLRKKYGATGTANVNVSYVSFDTEEGGSYDSASGVIGLSNGSVNFDGPITTSTPAPTIEPTAVPTTQPTNNPANDYIFDAATGTITRYIGSGGDVTIPTQINGVNVTGIGNNSFMDCTNITSINISEGITYVGYGVFLNCDNITSIFIPSSVLTIEENAFAALSGLACIVVSPSNLNYKTESFVLYNKAGTNLIQCPAQIPGVFTVPNGIQTISKWAFWGCHHITDVIIPNSVTNIEFYAFYDCTGLTDVELPSSLTSITGGVFAGCSNLARLTIPSCVTSIGENIGDAVEPFDQCNNLTIYTSYGSYAQTYATEHNFKVNATVLKEDFESYSNLDALKAAGWSATSSTSTPPVSPSIATYLPPFVRYLKTVPSTNASKTFTPIALKASAGTSPGKNAKLVVSYDAYTWGEVGSSQGYWKVYDSTSGNVAVSAGRRAGQGSNIRYAKTIPSPFTGITISSGLTRFTKIKFVIKITDENGAFLTNGPKVDIYCGNTDTPIANGVNVNMIDTSTSSIDKFWVGGAINMEVDNLDIHLETTI